MGSTLRGRGQIVLVRHEGLISHLGQVRWSVPGWTSRLCLRVSAHHVTQGVLPGVPQCVHTVGLTLALSRVLHGPLLGIWGGLSYPTLFSAGWGWCLGRLLSFAPCCRLCPLSGCTSLILCAPLAVICFQVHLTDSVPCLRIAF